MTKEPKHRGLGRGLAALLGDDVQAAPPPGASPASAPAAGTPAPASPPAAPVATSAGTTTVPITWLKASRYQPRTVFDPAHITQLADSIRAHGLVQPLLVRPVTDAPNRYEIVAGERRWRAAQQAQLHDVPVVVRALDDREVLEIALIENVQRADLTPIEEARAYRRLVDEFSHTQEQLAATIGKSRAHVANLLRLLDLPAPVQAHVEQGRLDMGHARALIGTPDPVFLADYVINKKLTARRAEQLAADAKEARKSGWDGRGLPPAWAEPAAGDAAGTPRAGKAPAAEAMPNAKAKTAETRGLERSIEEALGLKVSIDVTGPREEARLTIWMDNFDQMDDVVERLTRRR
ncbi:ParB/RepB/Spo0J family partition protein [Vineibacter terrae]|uniref:ParB/RepB/Spo0J family partition protein n=1 Tax=Vineibacter terrae TaxID=2586908 RepID=A0A5C8PGP3_9HYPH|nr:ParB/RepB/Spo0J family partition protein [Vineibacter terrae]TXL73003.1 ParB/RepB/Spo0J family partition protein [Vineibacter terrae]